MGFVLLFPASTPAGGHPRARDLGISVEGTPGPLNAITDVKGVEVGHATLVSGEGKLKVGEGPVRTGVTAILPRGKDSADPLFAGWFSLNGNGEMTGTTWIEESGFLEGPVLLTNTSSVGTVRDAVVKWWARRHNTQQPWVLPVVAETYDGYLNDTHGFHVKDQHAFEALDSARSGPVSEGSVGGGTGMTCFEFKGGIGTASRQLGDRQGGYTVGVLVQANFGLRHQLQIAGVPVGREISEGTYKKRETGSIIIVVATDAPLLPHQLKRLARRAGLGLARTGSVSGNGSGDLFLAFSTANRGAARPMGLIQAEFLPNERMDALFEATVQATEEAIVNTLVAARTMVGRDDHRVLGLPHERLREVLKKYNRLAEPKAAAAEDSLRKVVSFYASFDETVQADTGEGKGRALSTRFNHATEKGQFVFQEGFDDKVFRIAKGKGIHGGALEVVDVLPRNGRVFFPAKGHLAYKKGGWGGALSTWINTDPDKLLKTKFCDPVQITHKGANNGGIWFDFNDAKPRDLRMGVFPAVPEGGVPIKEESPDAPMVRVKGIGFKAGDWHHVVINWQNFDTGKKDALAALYIDGKKMGEVKDRAIAMEWDMDRVGIYIGVNYIGLLDEFALFDRPLSDAEIALLQKNPGVLAAVKKAPSKKD